MTTTANYVTRLTHGSVGLRLPLIRTLVLATIIPIITHGMPFWTLTQQQRNTLQSLYVQPLIGGLGLTGNPHHLSVLVECGVPDIIALIHRSAFAFVQRALNLHDSHPTHQAIALHSSSKMTGAQVVWGVIRDGYMNHWITLGSCATDSGRGSWRTLH